jgi:hypothetical protein
MKDDDVKRAIASAEKALTEEFSVTPVAWYDPTNHHVSTDKHDPLFTPLGQVWPLYAKQEQGEPVAWMNSKRDMTYTHGPYNADDIPLYTTPQQRTWVGLTDEQTTEVIDSMPQGINGWMSDWDLYEYANAIEAKLKEKNT